MTAFREPLFDIRDARKDEATISCNGCAEHPVVSVLEIGSRMRDGRGSSGTEFRLCRKCKDLLLRIMVAEYNEGSRP